MLAVESRDGRYAVRKTVAGSRVAIGSPMPIPGSSRRLDRPERNCCFEITPITPEHVLPRVVPIDIDAFEARDDHRAPTTSERVLRFLLDNDQQAYARQEIAEAIDVSPETVGTNLTRLKRRDLVRHREPYWAIAPDRERVTRFLERGEAPVVAGTASAPAEDILTDDATSDPTSHHRAATAFLERAREAVGSDVKSFYLFGSVASGDESSESDVDVLAVIAEGADYAAVDEELLGIAYDVRLEFGVAIDVHALRSSEFEARKERGEPFVRAIVEEGVIGG